VIIGLAVAPRFTHGCRRRCAGGALSLAVFLLGWRVWRSLPPPDTHRGAALKWAMPVREA